MSGRPTSGRPLPPPCGRRTPGGFTDVPDSNVFHDNIDWLADAQVTKGCNPPDNDEFCPSDYVTRERWPPSCAGWRTTGSVAAGAVANVRCYERPEP